MTPGAVVVTEATSDLGRALCLDICARGRNVVGLSRDTEGLDITARLAGNLFMGLSCDVADQSQVARIFAEIRRRSDGVSVLVNGPVPRQRRDILDESADTLMAAVTRNLGSVVNCTCAALPDMVDRGRGRIFNIGAARELSPGPASTADAMSHEAIRAFSRFLATDLADRFPNIVVTDWATDPLNLRSNGNAGGTSLEQVASWGGTLALAQEPALNGTTWVNDREVMPPLPIRQRLAGWFYGGQRVRRHLSCIGVESRSRSF